MNKSAAEQLKRDKLLSMEPTSLRKIPMSLHIPQIPRTPKKKKRKKWLFLEKILGRRRGLGGAFAWSRVYRTSKKRELDMGFECYQQPKVVSDWAHVTLKLLAVSISAIYLSYASTLYRSAILTILMLCLPLASTKLAPKKKREKN